MWSQSIIRTIGFLLVLGPAVLGVLMYILGLLFPSSRLKAIQVGIGLTMLLVSGSLAVFPIPGPAIITGPSVLATGIFDWNLSFFLDKVSLLMAVLVWMVSGIVLLYSLAYFQNDSAQESRRFGVGILVFGTAMMGLVSASNLLVVFAFWELVGFLSWYLVGFYTNQMASGPASSFVLVLNRFADLAFILLLIVFQSAVGSLSLIDISAGLEMMDSSHPMASMALTGAAVLVFSAAAGKSAQGFYYLWLPRAMQGPSPASALMHAATMVTSGVILLVRFAPIFPEGYFYWNGLLVLLSGVWVGFGAQRSMDLKHILALSTISQIGLMMAGLGSSREDAGLWHLAAQAFPKAGLFLFAGYLIHDVEHRKLKYARRLEVLKNLQLSGAQKGVFLVLLAGVMGMPGTLGLISKGAIYGNLVAAQNLQLKWICITLFIMVVGLTGHYCGRLVFQFELLKFRPNDGVRVRFPLHVWLALGICTAGTTVFSGWFLTRLTSGMQERFDWPNVIVSQEMVLALVSVLGCVLGYFWEQKRASKEVILQHHPTAGLPIALGLVATLVAKVIGNSLLTIDKKIDTATTRIAKGVVVVGHAIGAVDRLIIDGFVRLVPFTATGSSWILREQTMGGRLQVSVTGLLLGIVSLLLWMMY